MKRFFSLFLAVICLLSPMTVYAKESGYEAEIWQIIAWNDSESERYSLETVIPYVHIALLDDPYMTYAQMRQADDGEAIMIHKDGEPVGFACYTHYSRFGISEDWMGHTDLDDDQIPKLVIRYGGEAALITGGTKSLIVLPQAEGMTVYPLRSLDPDAKEHTGGVLFSDFMLCLAYEKAVWNTPYSISNSVDFYTADDIAAAKDYWTNKALWDKKLSFGGNSSPQSLFQILVFTGIVLAVIFLSIRLDRYKKNPPV